MKSVRRIIVAALVVAMLGLPVVASARIIYVVCAGWDAQKNCTHCSDYFSVQSEAQAEERCRSMGLPTPNYFPSVQRVFDWKRPNCSCAD